MAGKNRGFHGAVMGLNNACISEIFKTKEIEEVSEIILGFKGKCRKIAIDCPPVAYRGTNKTRLAERQLYSPKHHIYLQWTPKSPSDETPGQWMKNGENLWKHLSGNDMFDGKIIETFPTACMPALVDFDLQFPLNFFNKPDERKSIKDWIDAAICALVAREHVKNSGKIKLYGTCEKDGKYHLDKEKCANGKESCDVVGPIHILQGKQE